MKGTDNMTAPAWTAYKQTGNCELFRVYDDRHNVSILSYGGITLQNGDW